MMAGDFGWLHLVADKVGGLASTNALNTSFCLAHVSLARSTLIADDLLAAQRGWKEISRKAPASQFKVGDITHPG